MLGVSDEVVEMVPVPEERGVLTERVGVEGVARAGADKDPEVRGT